MVKEIWGAKFIKWASLTAVGNSGGIFVIWDTRRVCSKEQCVGDFLVFAVFEDLENHRDCIISVVYGPNSSQRRTDFWRELRHGEI